LAWLPTEDGDGESVTHPSTNRAQRRVTSLMRRTTLPLAVGLCGWLFRRRKCRNCSCRSTLWGDRTGLSCPTEHHWNWSTRSSSSLAQRPPLSSRRPPLPLLVLPLRRGVHLPPWRPSLLRRPPPEIQVTTETSCIA